MSFDEKAFRQEISYLSKRATWNLPAVIQVELAKAIAQHQPAAVIRELTRKLEIAHQVLESKSRNLSAMGGGIKKNLRGVYIHAQHVINNDFDSYVDHYLRSVKLRKGATSTLRKFLRTKFLGRWYFYGRTGRWRRLK